jgi:hypothetical protein
MVTTLCHGRRQFRIDDAVQVDGCRARVGALWSGSETAYDIVVGGLVAAVTFDSSAPPGQTVASGSMTRVGRLRHFGRTPIYRMTSAGDAGRARSNSHAP